MFFVYVVSFLMLLLDEYFLEPFDQVGILLRTCDLFLVKGQSHYDIINLKNHCLYICDVKDIEDFKLESLPNKTKFFSHLVLNASIFIIAKLVACPSWALLTKYSVVY